MHSLVIIFRNPNYRTPKKIQAVKTEGIGIIEVCGYGIYPVPHGDNKDKAWDLINNHGLEVIHGIISGNNPIQLDKQQHFWHQLCESLSEPHQH